MLIPKFGSLALGLAVVLAARGAAASIPIDDASINVAFNGFTGAGFQPSPTAGQLSSNDWAITGASDGPLAFGGTATTGDYARGASPGQVSTGGIYAFTNDGSNRMLGVQSSGTDFLPGTFTARFINDLSRPLRNIHVYYRIWVFADESRSTSVKFSYSTDDATYTDVPGNDFTTLEAIPSSPLWNDYERNTDIALDIPDGGFLYFRWTLADVGGSGSRDEIGLDDITIDVLAACGDGFKQGTEECDDGNTSNQDACLSSCLDATCGDGFVDATSETCDPEPGMSTECCSLSCQVTDGNTCSTGICQDGVCVADGTGGTGGTDGTGGTGGTGGTSTGGEGGEPATGGTNADGGMTSRGGRPTKGGAGEDTGAAGSDEPGGASQGGDTGVGGSSTGGSSSGGKSSGGKSSGGSAGSGKAGGGPIDHVSPPESDESGGCGCEVPGRTRHSGLPLILALALVAVGVGRRRQRSA